MASSSPTTPVPLVPDLGYCPASMFVGSYGGGAAMATARAIVCVELDAARIPDALKARVVEAAARAHAAYLAVPAMDRIATMPAAAFDPAGVKWHLRFTMSSHVYGAEDLRCNLMTQGFLFVEVVKEEGRLGCSRWPLVGMFDCFGVSTDAHDAADAGTGAINPAVGIDDLHPSDQHVHVVEGFGDAAGLKEWHAGSDMSRFHIEPGCGVAKAWCVCLDLETMQCEVSLMLIVASELESKADAAVRAADDGLDAAKLHAGVMASLGPAGAAPFADELGGVLLGGASS